MQVNDRRFGFTVERERRVEELGATLWELRHEKTGAQLVWLDNGERNKLFTIFFKTLPWDDTGVFHILEHSVLCGSERYPVKEPFLDLIKGSMNTFLNAFTFPDKTGYPVSSCNEKDFLNLTGVYLDAVFRPMIYQNESIFRQEGWRYVLPEGEAVPSFNGVVFNEMKGAYSSIDDQIQANMDRLLFPDSPYGFDSGGDPKAIPNLTYERFLDAHREFYHPSNTRIYLDGAVPIDETLRLIASYLDTYEKSERQHVIVPQKPIKAIEQTIPYAVGEKEELSERTQIVIGKVVCDWSDRKTQLAIRVLSSYLTGSNDAPLKKAILSRNLAQDVTFDLAYGIAQPYTVLRFKNTEAASLEPIRAAVSETVEALLRDGIDKDELSADIDRLAFQLKEPYEPRGVWRVIECMNSWLYDGDPLQYLVSDEVIAALRNDLQSDRFETLLRALFLDNAHAATLVMTPSRQKTAEDAAREEKRLKDAASTWTDADRAAVRRMNEKLDLWQQTPDSPEQKATLPKLALSDIDPTTPWTETEVVEDKGVLHLFHALPTDGIAHVSLYISLADRSIDEIAQLSFMASLFGRLPTAQHTLSELQKEEKRCIGYKDFSVTAVPVKGAPDRCKPFLSVTFSALEARVNDAAKLIAEMLLHTRFDEKQQVQALLKQAIEELYQSVIGRGNMFAMMRAGRHFSAASAVREQGGGFAFYRYLTDLSESFETAYPAFARAAEEAKRLFTEARLTISETGAARHDLLPLLGLEAGERPAKTEMTVVLSDAEKPEAILIPAPVSYASAASHLSATNTPYNGRMGVLSSVLSFGYLWNEVRVRGGAYGCGCRIAEQGTIGFYTYRDPSPMRSLEIIRDTARFVRTFTEEDESIESYIISTIAGTEALRSPRQKGEEADLLWLCGIEKADRARARSEMLSLKKDDLLKDCPLFDPNNYAVCVVCAEDALTETDGWTIERL